MSKGFVEASFEWDDEFVFTPGMYTPDTLHRTAKVKLTNNLEFMLRVLIDRELLSTYDNHDIDMQCNLAVGKCLLDFVTGAHQPSNGGMVELALPVESSVPIGEVTHDEFRDILAQNRNADAPPDADESQDTTPAHHPVL